MKLEIMVPEGGVIPRGYGVGRFEYCRRCTVYYPVPINLLVRASLAIWRRLAFARPSAHERMIEREVQKALAQNILLVEARHHKLGYTQAMEDAVQFLWGRGRDSSAMELREFHVKQAKEKGWPRPDDIHLGS